MNRTSKILAATVAALALTASLALAAETVNTQRDSDQSATGWGQCLGANSGYMGQNGYSHMSAEGYGRMGGNAYGHMDQDDFNRMNQNGYGHMGGNGYGHMGSPDRAN